MQYCNCNNSRVWGNFGRSSPFRKFTSGYRPIILLQALRMATRRIILWRQEDGHLHSERFPPAIVQLFFFNLSGWPLGESFFGDRRSKQINTISSLTSNMTSRERGHQLYRVVVHITDNINRIRYPSAVLVDVRQAFDRV